MIDDVKIHLVRVSGAENTFFIANLFDPAISEKFSGWSLEKKSEFSKKICTGYFGFQTDGVLFLRPEKNYDFAWDFYNADGSSAEMCGNAARCATVYFYEFIKDKKKIKFQTLAGDIAGEHLSNTRAQVEMTEITDVQPHLLLDGQDGFFVNTGVPHYVLACPPQKELAQKLRFHPHFGKAGSNITFIEIISEREAKAVTFERGVEDFTQACGTGAVATACFLESLSKTKNHPHDIFRIQMPGGLLEVKNPKLHEKPLLAGPVKIEFQIGIFGELV